MKLKTNWETFIKQNFEKKRIYNKILFIKKVKFVDKINLDKKNQNE